MRIIVKHGNTTIAWPTFLIISRKDANKPMLQFLRHMSEVQEVPTSGRTFHLEIFAIVLVEPLQTFDEQKVDRVPHWTAPVAVAAKHRTVTVAGPVADAEILPAYVHAERMFLVVLAQRAHTELTQEFLNGQNEAGSKPSSVSWISCNRQASAANLPSRQACA